MACTPQRAWSWGGPTTICAGACSGTDDRRYTANQIHFVTLIIDELTERGVVEFDRIYESPYDGVAPTGPEDLFSPSEFELLLETLLRLNRPYDEAT